MRLREELGLLLNKRPLLHFHRCSKLLRKDRWTANANETGCCKRHAQAAAQHSQQGAHHHSSIESALSYLQTLVKACGLRRELVLVACRALHARTYGVRHAGRRPRLGS